MSSKRYLLLRYLFHLELWKLGKVKDVESLDSIVPLEENEVLLFQLKAKTNDVILSGSLSDDGRYLAYSTDKTISFFKFSPVCNTFLVSGFVFISKNVLYYVKENLNYILKNIINYII